MSNFVTQILQPSELITAIDATLSAEVSVDYAPDLMFTDYPSFVPANSDHQVLIKLTEAKAGPMQNDGRIAQIFHCNLYIAVRNTQTDAHLQTMDLASTLAQHTLYNYWGFSQQAVQAPQRLQLQEATDLTDTDPFTGFIVWQVQWQQQLNLSLPQNDDDPEVTGIWLAVNPEDPDDIDQYNQITDEVA